MIKLTPQQNKKTLFFVLAILVALILYRIVTAERPRTAPLAFPPGSVARSSMRQVPLDSPTGADPLNAFFARHAEHYPGVSRDLFRMENPAPKRKPAPVIAVPPPPPSPQRTPEEIAADLSRADLAKFRFLGYLTAKDNTVFLSKEGELFIVKSGDKFHKDYQVKKATNDSVVLLDTVTGIEMRIDLSGGEPQQLTQQQPQQRVQQPAQQPPHVSLQPPPQQVPLQPPLRPSHQQPQKPAMQPPTQQLSDEPAQQLPEDEQGTSPRQLRRRIQKPAH
jgi:hypothetical protein